MLEPLVYTDQRAVTLFRDNFCSSQNINRPYRNSRRTILRVMNHPPWDS